MGTPDDLPAKATAEPEGNLSVISGQSERGEGGVKRALFSSALWTVFGFGATQVLRFASNILLTWLLLPEVFGLMALVDVFLLGLHLFSEVGIGTSVIRSPRAEEPRFLNTAWTLQVVRGAVLWLGSLLIAWPAASFYDEPGLPSLLWMLPAAGITALINGFNSTKLFTLERRLAQGPLVTLQLGTYVLSIAVTIAWVVCVEPTVWALLIGRLAGSVGELVGSHLLPSRHRNRFCWDRSALRELLHFGKWIFVGTVCMFLADRSDRLVIGKLESFGMLGVYNVAAQLVGAARDLIQGIISKLVFPVYSRLYGADWELRKVFARVHPVAAGFGAFAATGLIGTGPTAVRCLFRSDYHDAGWMLQLLAVGSWLAVLEAAEDAALFTLGMARVSAISNALKAISLPVLIPVGFWLGGFEGLIVGFVAADLVRYANTAWFTHRQGFPVFRYDFSLSLLIAAGSGLAILAGRLPVLAEQRWVRFATEVAVVVGMWLVVLGFAWYKGMLRFPATVEAA